MLYNSTNFNDTTMNETATNYNEKSVVTHPSHYTQGSIECIDAMLSAYGKEAVMNFCQCNAFKYLWRFNRKNKIEDLNKAQWYINKYIELHSK